MYLNRFIQHLESVDQKISDLIQRKSELKKKELKGQLEDEEKVDLAGMEKLLVELESRQEFWQEQMNKAYSLDGKVESKTFSEANLPWIQSVCNVNTRYRKWTQFVLDENIKPNPNRAI